MKAGLTMRAARLTDNLAGITEMYVKGLGFTVLAQFTEHEGDEWEQSCAHMLAAEFHSVPSYNPYWDVQGRTFEDLDGYRVVLQNTAWTT